MKAYIYKIENTITGDFYIGQTTHLNKRKNSHFSDLKRGVHCSTHMQNSFNKYGESSFKYTIVEEYKFPEEYTKFFIREYLTCMEIYFISKLQPTFNIATDIIDSVLGMKMKEETKRKVSRTMTGTKKTEEHCKNISIGKLGKKMSPEHNEANRQRRLGKKATEMAKKNMSNSKREIERKKGVFFQAYDLQGELKGKFNCKKDAAEALGMKHSNNISNCLEGRSKSSFGFIFKYMEENNG